MVDLSHLGVRLVSSILIVQLPRNGTIYHGCVEDIVEWFKIALRFSTYDHTL
jgi:hypothetical protein